MLSQTAEYALRAVVCLATTGDQSITSQQLAAAAHVPADYLLKVLHTLSRAGIVSAQRGKRGGFLLAKATEDLTILDVINAVDPVQRIKSCPLHIKSHGTRLCPLHKRLDEAMIMIEQAFGDTTVADLLNDPSSIKPLCTIRGLAHV